MESRSIARAAWSLAVGGALALSLTASSAVAACTNGIDISLGDGFGNPEASADLWMTINGVGNFSDGDTAPTCGTITYRLNSKGPAGGTISGPWLNQNVPDGQTLSDQFAGLLNVRLYNGSTELMDPALYWLTINGWGNVYYGDDISLPYATTITYRLNSKKTALGGTISGPWLNTSFLAGLNSWNVEYATVSVNLYNGGTDLSDNALYWLDINGWGTVADGGVMHLPYSTTITYRLNSKKTPAGGTISGPWLNTSFVAGDDQDAADNGPGGPTADWWDVEYATINVRLFNDTTELNDPALYWLDINGWGTIASGQTMHLPYNTTVTYRLNSKKTPAGGTISGPWINKAFAQGDDQDAADNPTPVPNDLWDVEYATVIVRLFNDTTELNDPALYWLDINGWGTIAGGGVMHLPYSTTITYRLNSKKTPAGGTISGPWLNRVFVAGDNQDAADSPTPVANGLWDVEYATIIVRLFNGTTVLNDPALYWLDINGWGTIAGGQTMHLPYSTTITYRLNSKKTPAGGTISGPWLNRVFVAGDDQDAADNPTPVSNDLWDVEYATVRFVFGGFSGTCTKSTTINGWGDVADNAKAHLPYSTTITLRANMCGCTTAWINRSFAAGDSTSTWSLGLSP